MASTDPARAAVLAEYRKTLLQHKEVDAKVRAMREETKTVKAQYDKTEDDLKALQSVGQIIGEVLKTLDEERVIVKAERPGRRRLPQQDRQGDAEAGGAGGARHDDADDHARAAARGRPDRLRHDGGGPGDVSYSRSAASTSRSARCAR